MKRLFVVCALAAAGCSAAEPLPLTVAECDAEIGAVRNQIDARKTEMSTADVLLKQVEEDRKKLANEQDSDAKTNRMTELDTAEAELKDKREAVQAELSALGEKLQGLNDHRKELAEAEAEAKKKPEEEAKTEGGADAEAKRKAEEEAKKKAEADAEAKRKAEEEAKAGEEARKKAEMEAEARRKADEEAKAKAEEEAKKKAEEDAAAKAKAAAEAEAKRKAEDETRARADAEAQKKLEEDARKKAEARAQAESLVVDGVALYREIAEAMKSPPEDPEKAKALLQKTEQAIGIFEKAKAVNASIRAESPDPAKVDERIKKIDQLIGRLRGFEEKLKK